MKIIDKTFKRNDAKITSRYGWRKHPVTQALLSWHSGIDFGTNLEKWNIYGLEKGVVIASSWNAIDGNYIWVNYPGIDLKLFYGHLDDRYVKLGDRINGDTILGKVGKSGRSTAIHLHLGVRKISTNKYFNFENYEYIEENVMSGTWDMEFTKLLQKVYGTYVDGIISRQFRVKANENIHKITYGLGGSNLVKAIQRDLKIKVDGYLGAKTISALQAKFGVKVTGYITKDDDLVRSMKKVYGG